MMSYLQKLGKSLMLPIAVMPVAGLMLRLGSPDLLNIPFLASAGDAVFANLAILFAIGIAVGFAKDNNGSAGLSGAVAFFTLTACAISINKDIKMGVFGGLIAGIIAGELYNRFHNIKLPDFLGFFSGRRFVPIVSGFTAVFAGFILGYVWPIIQHGLDNFTSFVVSLGALGTFVFGFFNRLLIPVGLHHVMNAFFWNGFGSFQGPKGQVVGDIPRFLAGDPTAGYFQSGFFPIMMFGVLGICLAIYTLAKKEDKKMVGGALISIGLTSFLTGITEPIEFLFMFLSPVLYFIHAIFTGLSMAITTYLHVRVGFSFSGSVLDYVINFSKGENAILIIPIGLAFLALYYFAFLAIMKAFKIRIADSMVEDLKIEAQNNATVNNEEQIINFIDALGGAENIITVDNCVTRLRLDVKQNTDIDEQVLKTLGSRGIVRPSSTTLQVILGQKAQDVADGMKILLKK
ncbi:MAG: N-acetylglucosamine-specific PTS transporter subunit IIBC [Culicoidibacterales bacterium]